jgi:hypothetical protein
MSAGAALGRSRSAGAVLSKCSSVGERERGRVAALAAEVAGADADAADAELVGVQVPSPLCRGGRSPVRATRFVCPPAPKAPVESARAHVGALECLLDEA